MKITVGQLKRIIRETLDEMTGALPSEGMLPPDWMNLPYEELEALRRELGRKSLRSPEYSMVVNHMNNPKFAAERAKEPYMDFEPRRLPGGGYR